jgi:hypothetical protein
LRTSLWYFFLTAALSFKKGFSTRTLSEFGREPLLPFSQVSTKRGASSPQSNPPLDFDIRLTAP